MDAAKITVFRDKLLAIFKECLVTMKGTWWAKKSEAEIECAIEHIWSFGPSKARANLLINCVADYGRPSIWEGTF